MPLLIFISHILAWAQIGRGIAICEGMSSSRCRAGYWIWRWNLPGNLGMTAEHEFRQQPKPSEIALPDKLAKIKKADDFLAIKYKWNTNEVRLILVYD